MFKVKGCLKSPEMFSAIIVNYAYLLCVICVCI